MKPTYKPGKTMATTGLLFIIQNLESRNYGNKTYNLYIGKEMKSKALMKNCKYYTSQKASRCLSAWDKLELTLDFCIDEILS